MAEAVSSPSSNAPGGDAESRAYIGSELEVFAAATGWKSYFRSKLTPFIAGDVLEAGAGIGSNTALLMNDRVTSWLCLEPDADMTRTIARKQQAGELPSLCTVKTGILSDTPDAPAFDTMLYIDVLEHIEQDRDEVRLAASRLKPGGRLIVLSPAHQWLYSPFDKAIGHFRRYSASALVGLTAPPLVVERAFYLDCAGVAASLANRMMLKSSSPTPQQIRVWDRFLVPASRLLDPLTFHRLGKSVIVVWRKPA